MHHYPADPYVRNLEHGGSTPNIPHAVWLRKPRQRRPSGKTVRRGWGGRLRHRGEKFPLAENSGEDAQESCERLKNFQKAGRDPTEMLWRRWRRRCDGTSDLQSGSWRKFCGWKKPETRRGEGRARRLLARGGLDRVYAQISVVDIWQ